MTVRKQLAWIVLFALTAGAIAYWWLEIRPAGLEEQASAIIPENLPPAPVIVQPVGYSSAAAVVEAVGTGVATQAVILYPESAGRVTEILFSAGENVTQGDILMRLDDDEQNLAVRLAEVRHQDAAQQLSRYENTAASGAVSTTEVESARTALAAASIELSQAQLALERRALVAPFDGVVSIPEVDAGDRVTTSTPITSLDDRSSLLVDFEVPEAFASGVDIGSPVEAMTWALPGEQLAGTVDTVASRIDEQTRTLRVRARIDNPDDRLRTGMSFTIRLPLQGERFPSVPSIAVQWDRTGAYVWRIENGLAQRVEVEVMKREKQWILVDAPLKRGDQIVVEGVQRLRAGRQVETVAIDAEPPDTRNNET